MKLSDILKESESGCMLLNDNNDEFVTGKKGTLMYGLVGKRVKDEEKSLFCKVKWLVTGISLEEESEIIDISKEEALDMINDFFTKKEN